MIAMRVYMGNAQWWAWECPECGRQSAVTDEGAETAEKLAGFTVCPVCEEQYRVDINPLEDVL